MKYSIWQANLIVFLASACTMIIELIAGRILAPYFGVSLYTWTSIIGVVLAGITIGNYMGGIIVDRHPSENLLSLLFLASSLFCFSILFTNFIAMNTRSLNFLPVNLNILLLTSLIFLIPITTLGMILPVVIKFTLDDLKTTGRTVGTIYASSAAGSILGTFLTGFYLISWFGTRKILVSVSLLLIIMAIILGDNKGKKWGSGIFIILAVLTLVTITKTTIFLPCYSETNYYCIGISDKTLEDGSTVKTLSLDRLIHSYVDPENPKKLTYHYEIIFGQIFQHISASNPNLKILVVGGGGYTFPRYVEATEPRTKIEVVEIDPGVSEVAYKVFGLSPDTKIITYNIDARMFIDRLEKGKKYDAIFSDAINDLSVPYHLTTLEFNEKIARILNEDGYYIVTIIDGREGKFFKAYIRTLKKTFPHVYMIPTNKDWTLNERTTFVIISTFNQLDKERFLELDEEDDLTRNILDSPQLNYIINDKNGFILTDDYVPVDNLLAPVFVETIEKGF